MVVAVAWTLATAVAPGPMIEGTPNPFNPLWRYAMPAELTRWLAQELVWPVLLLIAVGAVSLLVRLRQARGRQRQQVKWLAYAAVLLTAALVPVLTGSSIGLVRAALIAIALWAVYVAIGIAVLRYRLYDIDRLINRTLVYGVLTAILGLVYAGGVFVVGQVLNRAGGESGLAVAASTLAVAALFRPLRRRVQATVDRRFNRRRYDAAKTVEAFSGRLREHVDLETLSTELLAVVDQTMQPTRVSLWLRASTHGSLGTARSETRPATWAY